MAYLLVRHAVEDYDAWRDVFDDHENVRRDFGSQGGVVGHVAGHSDEVVVLLEWDDAEHARDFAESETLREAMAESGVVGKPDVTFVDDDERVDY